MNKLLKRTTIAGMLLACAGISVWFGLREPSPVQQPIFATNQAEFDVLPKKEAVQPAGEQLPAKTVLESKPGPAGTFFLFGGDTDSDGRLSVDEWFALDKRARPSIPEDWTVDEILQWRQRLADEKAVDPYTYFSDEEIVELAYNGDGEAQRRRARALMRLGRFDEVVALAEAGDVWAVRHVPRALSKLGRVDELRGVLLRRMLEEIRPDNPKFALELYTRGYVWSEHQPELGIAFMSAGVEMGLEPHLDIQESQAGEAGMTLEEARAAGRRVLDEIEEAE